MLHCFPHCVVVVVVVVVVEEEEKEEEEERRGAGGAATKTKTPQHNVGKKKDVHNDNIHLKNPSPLQL